MRALALFAVILISVSAIGFAQNVFHPAEEVKSGVFGSSVGGGNYTFNNSLVVVDNLGIGTLAPAERLVVNGTLRVDNATGSAVLFVNATSGNVGIGMATPNNPLEIGTTGSGVQELLGLSYPMGNGNGASINFRLRDVGDTTTGSIQYVTDNTGTGAHSMRFNTWTGGALQERMRINDITGNVGIGTASPMRKLDVFGSGGVEFTLRSDNGAANSNIYNIIESGGKTYFRALNDAGTDGIIWMTTNNANGNVGIGTINPLSKLSVGADGDANAGIYGQGATGVYGSGTSFGVYGSGPTNIGVYASGYNYGVYSLGGTYGVRGQGTGYGVYGYGNSYDFYAGGPGTDYGTSSSIRWKNNITPIDNALDKVMKMRGVYFTWDEEHGGQHGMGMIAEEVGKVVPEVVGYETNLSNSSNYYIDANGKKQLYATGMDYGHLTPVLVEAIKEQQSQIETQHQQIDQLKAQVANMTALLDNICSNDGALCK